MPAAALKKFATVADKPEWAVIYYAGNGISVRGNNDLVPVDAKLASDRDVTFEAITQEQVMQAVEGASKLPLVILDACRRSPAASCQARTSFFVAKQGQGAATASEPLAHPARLCKNNAR